MSRTPEAHFPTEKYIEKIVPYRTVVTLPAGPLLGQEKGSELKKVTANTPVQITIEFYHNAAGAPNVRFVVKHASDLQHWTFSYMYADEFEALMEKYARTAFTPEAHTASDVLRELKKHGSITGNVA